MKYKDMIKTTLHRWPVEDLRLDESNMEAYLTMRPSHKKIKEIKAELETIKAELQRMENQDPGCTMLETDVFH